MALRRILLPWDSQPQEPTPADRGHPLAAALENLWLPDAIEPFDVISGLRITGAPAGSALGVGVGGRAIVGTTGGSATALPSSRSAYPTVLVAYGTFTANNGWTLLSFTGLGASLILGVSSTGNAQLIVRRNFGTARTMAGAATYPVGTPVCAIVQIFSDTDYRLYANGEQTNGSLSFGTGGTWLTSQLPLAAQHPGSLFLAGQGFGRGSIPDSEALRISANPSLLWQLFEPQQILVPVASAGGAIAVGMSSEADTAQALAARQIIAAGISIESTTALALAPRQMLPAGLASETDSALQLAALAVRAAGMAGDTGTALALSPATVAPGTVGLAAQADSAMALAARQVLPVGMSVETGAAHALAAVSARTAGLALEINTAFALAAVQRRAAGAAVETSTALALLFSGATVTPPLSAPSIGRRLSTGDRAAQTSDGQRGAAVSTGTRAARLSTRTRA